MKQRHKRRGACSLRSDKTAVPFSDTRPSPSYPCRLLMLSRPDSTLTSVSAQKNRFAHTGYSFRDELSPSRRLFWFRGGAPMRTRTGTRLAIAKAGGSDRLRGPSAGATMTQARGARESENPAGRRRKRTPRPKNQSNPDSFSNPL